MEMTILNARAKLHDKWMELTKNGTDEEMMQAISIADTVLGSYDESLKADMVAMLEELRTQMEEYEPKWVENDEQAVASCRTWEDLDGLIQEKINAMREK